MRPIAALLVPLLFSCGSDSSGIPVTDDAQKLKLDTGPLEFYTFGFANVGANPSRARVARRWGISYRSIAGCVVSQELIDSAHAHNRAVEAELAENHGADWKLRFEREVGEAAALDSIIQRATWKNPAIAAAQKTLDRAGAALLFEPGALATDSTVEVVAYAYDQWEGQPAFVTRFTVKVDTKSAEAEIVNNNRWLFRKLE